MFAVSAPKEVENAAGIIPAGQSQLLGNWKEKNDLWKLRFDQTRFAKLSTVLMVSSTQFDQLLAAHTLNLPGHRARKQAMICRNGGFAWNLRKAPDTVRAEAPSEDLLPGIVNRTLGRPRTRRSVGTARRSRKIEKIRTAEEIHKNPGNAWKLCKKNLQCFWGSLSDIKKKTSTHQRGKMIKFQKKPLTVNNCWDWG